MLNSSREALSEYEEKLPSDLLIPRSQLMLFNSIGQGLLVIILHEVISYVSEYLGYAVQAVELVIVGKCSRGGLRCGVDLWSYVVHGICSFQSSSCDIIHYLQDYLPVHVTPSPSHAYTPIGY